MSAPEHPVMPEELSSPLSNELEHDQSWPLGTTNIVGHVFPQTNPLTQMIDWSDMEGLGVGFDSLLPTVQEGSMDSVMQRVGTDNSHASKGIHNRSYEPAGQALSIRRSYDTIPNGNNEPTATASHPRVDELSNNSVGDWWQGLQELGIDMYPTFSDTSNIFQ